MIIFIEVRRNSQFSSKYRKIYHANIQLDYFLGWNILHLLCNGSVDYSYIRVICQQNMSSAFLTPSSKSIVLYYCEPLWL